MEINVAFELNTETEQRHEAATREFKLHVQDKRQTSDSSWEFLKIGNKQKKQLWKFIWIKQLRETTNLCVEINSNSDHKTYKVTPFINK